MDSHNSANSKGLTTETIQMVYHLFGLFDRILDENKALIRACIEFQNAGKLGEVVEFQKRLHQNLLYLGTVADELRKNAVKNQTNLPNEKN